MNLLNFKLFEDTNLARFFLISCVVYFCCGFKSVFAEKIFVHPGNINSRENLDFVKKKIAIDKQPWAGKFNDMLKFATPYTRLRSPQDGDEAAQKADALKAYANALAWYFTGKEFYAQNAISVLNTWSKTFEGYKLPPQGSGNQSQLDAAWVGALFAPAAEILRGYSGWDNHDIKNLQLFFKEKFYPILNQVSFYNGNVDLTQIDALMNIAVFCDDEEEFNLGINRLNLRNPAYFYLSTDLPAMKIYASSKEEKWFSPKTWPDGLTQETCRDLGHHTQYGMASALHAAEIAFHQGVDVYTLNQARYTAAMELMARELLKGENRFHDICPTEASGQNNSRADDIFNTWEIGYNHYHNRMKLKLPYTEKLINLKIRNKSTSDWNIFYETLTHADVSK